MHSLSVLGIQQMFEFIPHKFLVDAVKMGAGGLGSHKTLETILDVGTALPAIEIC